MRTLFFAGLLCHLRLAGRHFPKAENCVAFGVCFGVGPTAGVKQLRPENRVLRTHNYSSTIYT